MAKRKKHKIIGAVTTYTGDEHAYMKNYKVRIIGVMKNALLPDIEDDDPRYDYINSEEALDRAGGVGVYDRVDVCPWIEQEGRFSWVSSDARSTDLEMFQPKTTKSGARLYPTRDGRQVTIPEDE